MDSNKVDARLEALEDQASQTSTEIAASWNTAQEALLAGIADRANCSRWLHGKCQGAYERINYWLTIPSIAVSALAGSATIGLPGLTNDPDITRWCTTAIGLLTLSTGVLTSINQYMKTSQLAEAHRAAAVAYGKLYRAVSMELALRRDQRLNGIEFLKAVRAEQDRLQDTSPVVLDSVIAEFREVVKSNDKLEKPEIVGDLDHVQVNRTAKPGLVAPLLGQAGGTLDGPLNGSINCGLSVMIPPSAMAPATPPHNFATPSSSSDSTTN